MKRDCRSAMVLMIAAACFLKGSVAAQRDTRRKTADLFRSYASLLHRLRSSSKTISTTTTTTNLRHFSSAAASSSSDFDYDFLVIGAGSGGIASARRASSKYGFKVAIVEAGTLGGTCVNRGCVPKKVMWNAAAIAEAVHDMEHFGFGGMEHITFDWTFLKEARTKYIERLNKIYDSNLKTSNVTQLLGWASLQGPNTVKVQPIDGGAAKTVTAKHILLATGGKPVLPEGKGIAENCITSDEFFDDLDHLPHKAVVVGGGYIAVELAGVLQALGTETQLVLRKHKALRSFDELLSDTLDEEMIRQGIEIFRNTGGISKVEVDSQGMKTVFLNDGRSIEGVDTVLVAPGRSPNTSILNLEQVGVKTNERGYIQVNEYSETNVPNVYAIGDVVGEVELTPTAIAAGRRLADRLFAGVENAKISYDLVPTVVFCEWFRSLPVVSVMLISSPFISFSMSAHPPIA